MAGKAKKQTATAMTDVKAKRELQIEARTPEEARRKIATGLASPETAAARAMQAIEGGKGIGKHLDTPELIKCLRDQAATVNRGDLSQAEAMLMNQATTLQNLFARLIERAMGNDTIAAFDVNMRMALRAQNQCRTTLETLALIKNPRNVAFVRQANIAHGPQQVNNAPPSAGEGFRARKIEIEQSKLSGGRNELLPDARASALAGRVDPTLETVGEIDRADIAGR